MNAKRALSLLSAVCLVFGNLLVAPAHAQGGRDTVVIPPSSVENPGDEGVRAHTNHVIFLSGNPQQTSGLPTGENPGSLDCVYNIPGFTGSGSPLCGTSNTTPNKSGGSGVIAIVDAYHYPNAYNDLTTFSTTFGLPQLNNCTGHTLTSNCFQVLYASGVKPRGNCSWNQEAALDIEWAHAMAPSASIVLVEASSSSLSNLLTAVNKATTIAETSINGMVSMSWGSSEFSSESSYDSYFQGAGVVAYFAAAGDAGGKTIWPGVSPNVVSAGGTRVNRDSSGNFTTESTWQEEQCGGGSCGGGGGPSKYETRPFYQNGVSTVVGSSRGTPDLSFDADPYTGVAVYDSVSCSGLVGWMVFGGTSVAAPSLAGIVSFAHAVNGTTKDGTGGNSFAEQTLMYSNYGGASFYGNTTFNDITSGYTGSTSAYPAEIGYDMATGIGSDRNLNNK